MYPAKNNGHGQHFKTVMNNIFGEIKDMPDTAVRAAQLPMVHFEATDQGASCSRIIGDGEMAQLTRDFAWAESPLGRVETWPDILVTTVNLLLASKHPMFLWWGPDLIQFYNDAYRPSISANKHPSGLGQRGKECWPEIWPIIGSQIEKVMAHGESTFHTNQMVPISRNGKQEEVFWTYSYNPVRGSDGTVHGTLVVCIETTEQVLSERRLRMLLTIDDDTMPGIQRTGSRQILSVIQAVAKSLGSDPADLPFAVLYLLHADGVIQAGSCGANSALADVSRWPLAKLTNSQTPLLLEDLPQRFTDLVCEPWPEPVTSAYLLPFCIPGSTSRAVLVLGLSPRLPFDGAYERFCSLVGTRVAGIIQRAALHLESIERTKASEQQAAALAEKAALVDLAQDAIVVKDVDGRVLFWNHGAEVLYGWSQQDMVGQDVLALLKSELPEPLEALTAKIHTQGYWEGEVTHYRRNGTPLIVHNRTALLRGADGKPHRHLTINHDITALKQAESSLRLLTERLSLATAIANIGVWEWDLATNTIAWDATMFAIYGMAPVARVLYEKWAAAVHPEDLPRVEDALHRAVGEKGKSSGEFRIIRPDGSVREVSVVRSSVLDEFGGVSRVVGVSIDVTERKQAEDALRRSEAAMTHSAEHDFLTGLPNRMLMNDRINQAIIAAQRHGKKVSVLFLDLDGFKHINDSLGHSIGDKLLQSIANRLVTCIRASDTVSRQGGDEFIVLLSEVDPPEDTAVAARRLLKETAKEYSIEGHSLHVTVSIGVSVYPDDGLDAETLIKNADTAMYQVKENGRRGFQFFKPAMHARTVERQSIEENLRRALERQEFALHYQPRIDLKTGEITGAEALLRWTHPTRGPIPPAQFIPVAEDSGLILPIGKWVLREACRQGRVWIDAGLTLRSVAVNISAVEFRSNDFLQDVFAILEETGLHPNLLELELTESVLMKHAAATEFVLKTLRARGISLALDDFGTGYSSLSYLRKFPFDALKIDKSFVREVTTTSGQKTIIIAIINMGRSLNLRVVAEGVETMEEVAFLKAHECHEGQGYYFSRPVLPEQFAKLLENATPGSNSRLVEEY
jgi:diguanylate cyclase (GGDEF)-like protein/PAS domain S-box-containing protein